MSRRRRQRNPLLIRIVLISLAAHVVALPILAHFGVFDKGKKGFGTANVVMLESEKKTIKPPPAVKKEKKAEVHNADTNKNKGATGPRKDLVKVAVADGPGGNGAPTTVQGTQQGGTLPPGVEKGPVKETKTADTTPPPVKPFTEPPPVTPTTTPVKPVVPVPTPVKHVPKYTSVEPVYQPEPAIPDDLRDEPLDKTAVIEVTVGSDGSISSATLAQGTGIRELDDIALKTAKTWRFKPATADGDPVTGKLRLKIEFKVE